MTLPETRSANVQVSGERAKALSSVPLVDGVPVEQAPHATSEVSLEKIKTLANTIRKHVIQMTGVAGSGHPGGSLSAADILATLYCVVLRHNPAEPKWPERDRFILSKGHSAPALYATLAEMGYFSRDLLLTLRKLDSPLQGHTDRTTTPGVEASAGSLGQGLSIANGMALAARLDKRDYRVYTLLGDGECDEGQVWEAAMAAAHYKLENVTAIVDRNGLQIDGKTSDIMDLEPFAEKWRAFGWHTIEVNGHDIAQLIAAFGLARGHKGRPTAIIAYTVKGKGVSFMENNIDFHGKAPTKAEMEKALQELDQP